MKRIISSFLAIIMFLSTTNFVYAQSVVDTESNVTEEMCNSSYWKNNNMYDSSEIMLSNEEIEKYNKAAVDASGTYVFDLTVSGKKTYAITSANRTTRSNDASPFKYSNGNIRPAYIDGTEIDSTEYFGAIKQAIYDTTYTDESRRTELAVATKYTPLLSMPSKDIIGYSATDPDNEIQNSALVVNEPFIIRQTAIVEGTRFYFGYTTNMSGWVCADDLALFGTYESWLDEGVLNEEKFNEDYNAWLNAWNFDQDAADFLVVNQDKIILESSYIDSYTSEVRLSLSTALRLVPNDEKPRNIGERGTWNNYVVYLPTRDANGQYVAKMALISQHYNVSVGYLEYTQGNLLDLAFSCLGNRYGWSGMLNAFDCSLYVRTVYRCFGFEMPRNTTYQLKVNNDDVQTTVSLTNMTDAQKAQYISTLPVGTALYFSGHTMLYVGTVNGENYVISALGSTSDPEGTLDIKSQYCVALNTLSCRRASGNTWLHDMKNAVIVNNPYDINDCDITATKDTESSDTELSVKYNGVELFEGLNYNKTIEDNKVTIDGITSNKTFTSSKTVDITIKYPDVVYNEVVTGDYSGKTVVLHTNDVHGSIENYAKVAELKKEYKSHGADVILADAGDYLQGTSSVSESKGESAIQMMNAAGYDIATLGNHEFDYGVTQLQSCLSTASFDVICSNVNYQNKPLIENGNEIITTTSSLNVGFYGITTPDIKTSVNPVLVKEVDVPEKDKLYSIVQTQINELKNDGADVVIGLSHIGVVDSSKPYRSVDIYNNTTGSDFVIDGHSHTVMTSGENGEPVQSTGSNMENIGVIVIDNSTKKVESNYLTKTADVDSDRAVLAKATKIIDEINEKYGNVFASSLVDLDGSRAPGNRTQETNLGDLVADSYRWAVTKEANSQNVPDENIIAIENGGGIRASIKVGDITRTDIKNVLPFNNTITMIYLKGSELIKALETVTQETPTATGGFPQVSGIELTINTTKEYDSTGELIPDTTCYNCNSIQRVSIQSINGKPFDENAVYGIATNNFLAVGGSGYVAFANSSGKIDTGIACESALVDYISNKLNGTITSKYASPQGRTHIFEESGKSTIEPTCTSNGYTTYTCSHCDYTIKNEITDFDNHSYKKVVSPASCKTMGYTTYTCIDCGYSFKTDYTKYASHKSVLAKKAVKATYFKNGTTATYKCGVCGKSISGGKTTAKKAVTITKITPKKKYFTISYKKATGATGYQVKFSKTKKFKTSKTIKSKGTSTKITGLTSGKKYYVKVRAYKTKNGKTTYSSWSKANVVTIK